MKLLQKRLLLIVLLGLLLVILSGCGGMTTNPETGASEYRPGIFEPLAVPLRASMVFFHDRLVPLGVPFAWGWAVILVAVLIRLLLLPLGIRQMRAMREAAFKMKRLQPELDALKKKYAKDKQRLQQETVKLQQEHGIMQAQMAGCLPTLLQMPILFAFYYAILGLIDQGSFKNSPFFFIPDLSLPNYGGSIGWLTESFSLQKLTEPMIWPYLVLPVILAVTQYLMTKLSQASQPQTADPDNPATAMMGQMMWIMTAMFVFFALTVPAGLSLYWVVGNVLALAQQIYVNQQKEHWEAEMESKPMPAIRSVVEVDDVEETAAGPTSPSKPKMLDAARPLDTSAEAVVRRKRRKRR